MRRRYGRSARSGNAISCVFMALVAAVLLLGSFWATRHLAGTSDSDRTITTEHGPAIWRTAMPAVLFATVRLGLIMDKRSWKM
jgi:hypothetical protein